jgi:alpha-beta hydrolase superfamily lysophospholipase
MTVAAYAVGAYSAGESSVLTEPKRAKRDGSSVGVIAVHGHGGTSLQFQSAGSGSGGFTLALALAGFTVLSIDAGGPTPWADDAEMTDLTAAYNYLLNTIHVASPKVCVLGWSMGGLAALNWVKRNPTLVKAACVFAPATDLAYFHDTSVGKATYAPEIEADYGGSAGWAAGIVGHAPIGEPANYRGLPPVRIYHGDADTTVPLAQSQAFVNAVNDPHMALRVIAGRDHSSVFDGVNVRDVVDLFAGTAAA